MTNPREVWLLVALAALAVTALVAGLFTLQATRLDCPDGHTPLDDDRSRVVVCVRQQ